MSRAREMTALLMLAAAETIVWAAFFYLFPILLLRWEADFGWARGEVALAMTLALAVSALSSPLVGRLIDMGLSRHTLPGAAALGGLLLLALTQIESYPAFLAIWALIGLCCGASLYDPCFSFITRVSGDRARSAITTITLIAGFASTICFPIADALTEAYGWRAAAQFFAAAALFGAVPLFAVSTRMLDKASRAGPKPDVKGEREAARAARANPAFWLLALAFPAVAMTHGMIISNIMPIMADRGADQGAAILAASLIGPMQVAGRVTIMTLGRKKAPLALTLISFTGIALAIMVLLSAHVADARIYVFVTILGACYGVVSIARPLVIADLLGRRGFGAISGMLSVPYIAGIAAAPFTAVLLWRLGGYDLTLAMGAALALAGAGFIFAAGRTRPIEAPAD